MAIGTSNEAVRFYPLDRRQGIADLLHKRDMSRQITSSQQGVHEESAAPALGEEGGNEAARGRPPGVWGAEAAISGVQQSDFERCQVLGRRASYRRPVLLASRSTWARCISGPEKFGSSAKKDFFNTIRHERSFIPNAHHASANLAATEPRPAIDASKSSPELTGAIVPRAPDKAIS